MRSAECGMHTEFSQEATERTEERELLNFEHRVEQKVTKARKGRIEQEATERTEEELHGLHGLHRYMGCQAQTPWWIQQKGTKIAKRFSWRFVFSICSNLISVFTMYWVTKRVTEV